MVQVQLTAQLKVQGGPALAVGSALDPESYTFASVVLDAAGGADAEQDLALLPDAGTVVLLAVNAHLADGKTATVTLTPKHGATSGDALTVDGTLVVAHAGVLGALVAGGPRLVTLTNAGAAPVTVDVLAALEAV
ncbi:MAG: hypothetical protein ACOH2F_05910 [Cellulomonas sp.]